MELLPYVPGGLLLAYAVIRLLKNYRGNALVTLGTITLATVVGFGVVVRGLPPWFADAFSVVVIGGLALATLGVAVWRPLSRRNRPGTRRQRRV